MKIRQCKNCRKSVHIPDDHTGIIHLDGLYKCDWRDDPKKQKVAE